MIHPAALLIFGLAFGFTMGWTARHRLRPRRAILVAVNGDPTKLVALATDGPFAGMSLAIATMAPDLHHEEEN